VLKAQAPWPATALRYVNQIRERLPQVEIRHHGGTSVPGLLTSGKRDHEGGSLADYKAAKRDFFHKIVRVLRGTGSIDRSR
jgi:hypothetical protein